MFYLLPLPLQDLARWKSRRRSASQDLIKKEEERKKMEKLLAGEDGMSERRKSIKTYREIVQEKWVLSVVVLIVECTVLSRCAFPKNRWLSPWLWHQYYTFLQLYQGLLCNSCDCCLCSCFPSHAHPLGSGERGSCMRHTRMHGPRRRRKGSSNSTSRGSPSAKLSLNAWRCQKFWKEAIQQSQTYPPSWMTPTPWNTCGNSHCLHPNSLPPWKPPSLVPVYWMPACQQAVGLQAKLSLPKQCLCWHPSLTPSPKTLKRSWRPSR